MAARDQDAHRRGVLAVFDRYGEHLPSDHAEAAGIVAELMSAARDYADVEENAYDNVRRIPARARLRKALAAAYGVAP